MRILHVGKFYPPARGGMERVVQVLCEAERAQVDSRVLVANESPATVQETVEGVPVTRVGSIRKVGAVAVCPTFPWWLWKLSRASDVLVVHEPNPVAIVAHALVRPRQPFIFWVHAEVVRPQWRYKVFYRPFLRRMLARAARIVVASPQVAEYAEELQPFRSKCLVVPYAIDPEQHAPAADVRTRAAAIASESRRPMVLFVGRLVAYKGVDILLRAIVDTDVRAVIVGDGPLMPVLTELARDLGIADRVRFAGNASPAELTALYNACDLFVLPSVTRAEAFGMVQIEAMSCGKPVICTDLPSGVPWVNQHGETGLVVPPSDVGALRDAIRTLAENPALRTRMGEQGRQRVREVFSIRRLVAQTSALYRAVVETPIQGRDGNVVERVGA
jgi:glycosyltransferase involved in cell wall biosynthesis